MSTPTIPRPMFDAERALASLKESGRYENPRMPIGPERSVRAHYDQVAEEGIVRLRDGRLSTDEVNAILADIRAHLESPKGTMRNDRLEDDSVVDFARRALVCLAMKRDRGEG